MSSAFAVSLRRPSVPDSLRACPNDKFEVIRMRSVSIGRTTYEPGWKWSVCVGRALGLSRGTVENHGPARSGFAIAIIDGSRVR